MKLYLQKKDCYGCEACVNSCKKEAITMAPDEYGFLYPQIDTFKCSKCGVCKKNCPFDNSDTINVKPLATFAAINKNMDILKNSSSGGAFSALAYLIFDRNGIVIGSAINNMNIEHLCISDSEDLPRLQGSKYVQSRIHKSYKDTESYLSDGKWVLFVGTPCQVAGLKSCLQKEYEKLLTVDLICHGVPSESFFKGYIKHLEEKIKGTILNIKFRDKSKGWGYTGKVIYKIKGQIREKYIPMDTSYYYSYFLRADICRESCYKCKYACSSRQGDFTLGDYWGIKYVHPEIKRNNGVSLFLINSPKGLDYIDELKKYIELYKSDFFSAIKQNEHLKKPIQKRASRDIILDLWRYGGYQTVANDFDLKNKKSLRIKSFKRFIPESVKKRIKAFKHST